MGPTTVMGECNTPAWKPRLGLFTTLGAATREESRGNMEGSLCQMAKIAKQRERAIDLDPLKHTLTHLSFFLLSF